MSGAFQRLQEALNEAKIAATHKVNEVASINEKIVEMWPNKVSVEKSGNRLTTDSGTKVYDVDHWLKVVDPATGQHGPSLLEDQIARERIHRFDHERIPERVVHARGAGAHGYFKLHMPIPEFSCAPVLNDTSRSTPIFVRFSTVAGSRGSADTVRDVRGFAVKFYTDEGNWDIVGNNIPVFFIQDAIKFPDFVHSVKPEPHNEVPQAQTAHNNFWDFQYLHSESTHMFTWAMSDRAIPRSFRMMQGFGVNTFTLINAQGERTFVKFVWTPELGVHSLVWDEALKLAGQDPDFHRKDLYESIENGYYPKWRFGIQFVPEKDQDRFEFDILDATKVWPEDLVPVNYIGELVLNRNVDEFFAETEQVAFCTSHVVPGIGFSDDPLLQGRNFSYFDTQITRLGINWEQLPINRPICPVMNFNRDGALNHRIHKGKVNYWPNRFEAVPPASYKQETDSYQEYAAKIVGLKQRVNGAKFREHFAQAQLFYNSLAEHEKKHVEAALAFELSHCDEPIVYKRISERLADIDLTLAQNVAKMVGGDIPREGRRNHGRKAPGLSQADFPAIKPSIETRRVAMIIADGFDMGTFTAVRTALKAEGAKTWVIAPRRGMIFPTGVDPESGTGGIMADHHLEGQRSTMFDAVFVCPGAQSTLTLRENGRAVHWVREAFGHLKPIGALGDAVSFLQQAVVLPGVNIAADPNSDEVITSYGVVTGWKSSVKVLHSLKIEPSASAFSSAFAYEISKHRCWERELDGLHTKLAF
ncbi:catalase-domain-containing protein [Choiromyces venosus 120613-1]|uniref:Catalase n=1 Tax=Choiromyces venosus 120613-1 TaxID=1336337 RepID=A0A3N4K1I2_9PEZI|nr:catalase-domain-containing protein [Choiromyces venosus 120613-1]